MDAGIIQEYEERKLTFGISFIPSEKKLFNPLSLKKRKVLIIAGPTGTGKTELSLLLAQTLSHAEIISADSMQVYRGMDIGTAKVSLENRKRLPHHLIDIRDVDESFNVFDFYIEAQNCIDTILAKGHVPIIVGGSGFYIRSLLYGPPDTPPSIEALRKKLEKEMEALGVTAMFQRLQSLDPTYAATITKGDKHKIIRALEIIAITGGPVSQFSWKCRYPSLDYDFHCWFIYRPREILYKILERRCEVMLDMGFIEEVENLEKEGLRFNPTACQAIGYKQCLHYLQTAKTPDDLAAFLESFKLVSRHYAKKQFTWFRKEPIFKWLNVDLHDMEIAMEMILQDFNR